MNFRADYFLPLVLGCVFLASFASCSAIPGLSAEKIEIECANGTRVPLSVEVARTAKEQQKGYMGRQTIPDGTGMVFVFKADQQMNFWMKNTPHPLSIAYIDSSGFIREIYELVPYSLETVSSIRSLRFALEVPLGWFDRSGISVGDRLTSESVAKLIGKN